MAEKRSRRRGRGSLLAYKTKAGERWKYQIYVPVDPENLEMGDRRITRGGFADMELADRALQEALEKRDNNERFHGRAPILAAFAQDWLDGLDLEDATMRGYRRQVENYITPHLGQKPINEITVTAIKKLYKTLRESGGKDGRPLGSNTISKTAMNLASILDAAVNDGYIKKNPARHSDVKKITPSAKRIRSEAEEMEVWDAHQLRDFLTWNQHTYQDPLHALWLTMARTGMRRGEAVALQWGDVDYKAKRVTVRRAANSAAPGKTKLPKSGHSRTIDVDDQVLEELKALKAMRGSISLDLARPRAFIFGDDNGKLKNPQFASKAWARRIKAAQKVYAELPSIGVHGLRHTHATLLFLLGETPKVVSERLGHTSVMITMTIYQHVLPSMQRAAADKFSALLDEA